MSSDLALFCLATIVLILTPGPNFLYIVARGATQGRQAGVLAAVGLGLGVLVHTALAALGVAALIRSSYLAFQLLKYGGSLYLVYLGVRALSERRGPLDEIEAVAENGFRIVCESILASLTNPKTVLFFLSFLPQFVDRSAGHVPAQVLLLGAIYMLVTVIAYGFVGYYAGTVGRRLQAHDTLASRIRWVKSGSFVGVGIWAALPDRR